jgi:hypothetical protein
VGKALAVGTAVLAAEATLAWLRRRTKMADPSSLSAARDIESGAHSHLVGHSLEEVFIHVQGDAYGQLFARRAVRVLRVLESPKK